MQESLLLFVRLHIQGGSDSESYNLQLTEKKYDCYNATLNGFLNGFYNASFDIFEVKINAVLFQ